MWIQSWQFLFWYDRPEGSPRQRGDAGSIALAIEEISDLKHK